MAILRATAAPMPPPMPSAPAANEGGQGGARAYGRGCGASSPAWRRPAHGQPRPSAAQRSKQQRSIKQARSAEHSRRSAAAQQAHPGAGRRWPGPRPSGRRATRPGRCRRPSIRGCCPGARSSGWTGTPALRCTARRRPGRTATPSRGNLQSECVSACVCMCGHVRAPWELYWVGGEGCWSALRGQSLAAFSQKLQPLPRGAPRQASTPPRGSRPGRAPSHALHQVADPRPPLLAALLRGRHAPLSPKYLPTA